MSVQSLIVNASRSLSTADERSDALVGAAVTVFARAGFHATPVAAVAESAGISTAYAFKLFPSKVDLFVACVDLCFERIVVTLRAAVRPTASSEEILADLGSAYAALIADRSLLMLQVHALAAASEPRIREAVRRGTATVVEVVTDLSGAPASAVQQFFAVGQLCHLLTAIDAFAVDASWSATLTTGIEHAAPES